MLFYFRNFRITSKISRNTVIKKFHLPGRMRLYHIITNSPIQWLKWASGTSAIIIEFQRYWLLSTSAFSNSIKALLQADYLSINGSIHRTGMVGSSLVLL